MGITWVLLKGIHLFGISQKTLPSSQLLFRICMVLFIAELAALLAGCYTLSMTVYVYFFNLALCVALFYVLVIAIPVIFARIKKAVYNLRWSAKKSDSKEIYSSVLSGTKYSYNAEVLVFGHTHVPGYFLNAQDTKEKPDSSSAGKPALLINAGTWVREESIIDSFIYIDRTGVALMQWVEGTGIVCLNHFPADIILSRAEKLRTQLLQTP